MPAIMASPKLFLGEKKKKSIFYVLAEEKDCERRMEGWKGL